MYADFLAWVNMCYFGPKNGLVNLESNETLVVLNLFSAIILELVRVNFFIYDEIKQHFI